MRLSKKIFILLFMMIGALLYSGCASNLPEMEQEEREQIVEYAAGLLLKHNHNSTKRLVDLTMLEEETGAEELSGEKTTQPDDTEQLGGSDQLNTDDAVSGGVEIVDNTEEEMPQTTIEEFFGLNNIQVNYQGFRVVDDYPEANGAEVYFSISATPGQKLMVLEFELRNISESEVSIDMMSKNAKFKIGLNDGQTKKAMFTMLADDFTTYSGTLRGGENKTLVIICEVDEGTAQEIEAVSINVKNETEGADIVL